MRLQKLMLSNQDQASSGQAVGAAPSPSTRITVCGMESGSLHYGIATDDELIIAVAPSTERRSTGHGTMSYIENLIGAASARKCPIVLLNPQLLRRTAGGGVQNPYLLSGFSTAFYLNPTAWVDNEAYMMVEDRRVRPCSCAVLRRYPHDWETFVHDARVPEAGHIFGGSQKAIPTASDMALLGRMPFNQSVHEGKRGRGEEGLRSRFDMG
eukprot:CAMPEP_0185779770 /NCGR_PEP_ID=MMETSP1174-20130828/96880_1 /TAXON_ID=35687 /ORGANISM="Dictyocha speculum, Strain CCMP1381" /LENGTH=210 /DNA_ID=CAMNT_0028469023 /DNA_START=63 /DNA_END=695 /DNA_ORIENTATION=+